jgi:hypothetical protein
MSGVTALVRPYNVSHTVREPRGAGLHAVAMKHPVWREHCALDHASKCLYSFDFYIAHYPRQLI